MIKFLFLIIFILSCVSCGTGCNDCPGASCFATNCSSNCSPPNNSINICPCNWLFTRSEGDSFNYQYTCTIEIDELPPCYVDSYCEYASSHFFGFEFSIEDCGSNYNCPNGSTKFIVEQDGIQYQQCLWKIPRPPGFDFFLLQGDCITQYYSGKYGFKFQSDRYFQSFFPSPSEQDCVSTCCFKEGCNDPCLQPKDQC